MDPSPIPIAVTEAMGHADIKTTMIYGSLSKSHIREQVERLNGIRVLPPQGMKALPAPACVNGIRKGPVA